MEVKTNGIYKHFKGDYYLVIDIATCSETNIEYVVYRSLYRDNKLWVRPMDMFIEKVNRNNQEYRFELQEVKSVKDLE